ncbi:hypothetical protein KP509_29G007300 [Ceratopteris richardii]|uniref:Uncharacterized protein n=1 Tax=Ceratopteris richardii TaxID=49495 RepID=A0A8T2R641_CERRI|nr:hypothetical protein KP509_29G007300 [Ceratopteris richardii]
MSTSPLSQNRCRSWQSQLSFAVYIWKLNCNSDDWYFPIFNGLLWSGSKPMKIGVIKWSPYVCVENDNLQRAFMSCSNPKRLWGMLRGCRILIQPPQLDLKGILFGVCF